MQAMMERRIGLKMKEDFQVKRHYLLRLLLISLALSIGCTTSSKKPNTVGRPTTVVQEQKEQNGAEIRYREATRINTIEAYQQFIRSFPESKFAIDAWGKLTSNEFRSFLNKAADQDLHQIKSLLNSVLRIRSKASVIWIGSCAFASRGVAQIISADEKAMIELTSTLGKVYARGYGPYYLPRGYGAVGCGGVRTDDQFKMIAGRLVHIQGFEDELPRGSLFKALSQEDITAQGTQEPVLFMVLSTPAWGFLGNNTYIYDGETWFVKK